ncbi:MAG: extracellular solute-binding protein [Chitinophagaceae bacterium]|nr:extracellular solute-binding protein [Chitinophagaceae bacterium]
MAAFLSMSALAGCVGKKNTDQASNTPKATVAPKEKTKLQFFTWSTGAQTDIQASIDDYNKTNKDNIEIETLFRSGDWQTPLRTMLAAAQGPDIMHGTPNRTESILNGWIEPWDSYMSKEFKERVKGTEVIVVVNGKPQTFDFTFAMKSKRMLYNKDLFKEAGLDPNKPPKSLADFREYAKKITEKGAGKYYGTAFPIAKNNTYLMVDAFLNMEGLYNNWDYKTGTYKYSVLAPYFEFYKQMMADKSVFPGAESMDNDAVRSQFAAGKVGMLMSGLSWDVKAVNDQFKATIDWAASPIPTLDGKEPKSPYAVRPSSAYNLYSGSKNKPAAMKVVEFFMSDKYLGMYYEKAIDMVTINSAVVNAKAPTDKMLAQWPMFAPTVAKDLTIPVGIGPSSGTLDGDNDVQTFEKILLTNVDIKKSLADLDKRYMDAMTKQIPIDLEKAKSNKMVIDTIGKIPVDPSFDYLKPDFTKVKYISFDEWKAMSK